jgi:hypothetical protein
VGLPEHDFGTAPKQCYSFVIAERQARFDPGAPLSGEGI